MKASGDEEEEEEALVGGRPSHDRLRREQFLGDSGPRAQVLPQAQLPPPAVPTALRALPGMGGVQGLLGPPRGVRRVCAHALMCVCVLTAVSVSPSPVGRRIALRPLTVPLLTPLASLTPRAFCPGGLGPPFPLR